MSFDVTTLALAKSYADQHGGGGASTTSDFIIKMTVESDYSGNYTVTSCDATFEQIDAAYNADKNIVLKVAASGYQGNGRYSLPVVSAAPGNFYYFCGLDDLYVYLAFFDRDHSEFSASNFPANNITYSNTALPNVKNVKTALDELVPKSHSHDNKDILDKLSDSNGNLTYNGEQIGGEDTIYIPVTINSSGDPPIIETSATFEQIEAAYNLGRDQILKLFVDDSGEGAYLLPLVAAIPGTAYYFETFVSEQGMLITARDTGWSFSSLDLTPTPKGEIVNDVLAALPTWTGGSY